MATPLSADRMLAALRAEGLHVVEHPGWRTHNRAGHGAWGPLNGVMIHHTGGTAPSDEQIVWAGRSDLPGPCAHAYLATDGTITLMGNGRANHAGGGDPAVLQAVIDESYGARPPAPRKHEGSSAAVDGNAHFYGLECSDLGTGAAWPRVQYDAAVRWAAALCRAHGWSAKSAIGHKEWSDWKPDPKFDMAGFRAAVAERLAHPASWTPGAPTNSTTEEEDPMAGITKQDIFDAVWRTDAVPAPTDSADNKTNPRWMAQSWLTDIGGRVRAIQVAEAAQSAAIAKLASLVGSGVDTATVVAAVQDAIKDAVVKVNVDITGTQS